MCVRVVLNVRAIDAGYVQSVRSDVTVYDSLSFMCNVRVRASFALSSGTDTPLESAVCTRHRLGPSLLGFFLRRSCSFAAELRTSFIFCGDKQQLMLRRQELHSCCPSLQIAVDYMFTT